MKAKAFLSVAYLLLGLLAVGAAMAALGSRDTHTQPVASSYGPSGTSIFRELLRRSGMDVVVDESPRPKLLAGDTAIAFVPRRGEEDVSEMLEGEDQRTEDTLLAFAKNGGTVVILPFSRQFQDASRELQRSPPTDSMNSRGDTLKVTLSPRDEPSEYSSFSGSGKAVSLWEDAVHGWRQGKGRVVAFTDGLLATNRFIDREDNAALLLTVVKASKGSGRIVFCEATSGNVHDPGLMARIGNWASVAWYQFLFVALVVAVSLGVRFGLPETTRASQRGSRELVEAVADTLKRGKKGQAALMYALRLAEIRIRERYKIPRDASYEERNRLLPEDRLQVLREADIAARDTRLSPGQALEMAQRLDRIVAKPKDAV